MTNELLGVRPFPEGLVLEDADVYNAWLRDPESADSETVAEDLAPEYRQLVDFVLYAIGERSEVPVTTAETDPRVAALLGSARAAMAVEQGDSEAAVALLREASDRVEPHSPALAGILLGNAGTLVSDPVEARLDLERALKLLDEVDAPQSRAELHHALGAIAHQEALELGLDLKDAMGHYYAGLQMVSEASAPQIWAALQLDLATAQLAAPMKQATDQLRIGVAAAALRACRRVFTPEASPGPWSSATLNLANALVYMPSTHQADNLVEAVELYEEVLTSGVRDDDVVGRARVMANQGNALAHLGIFDQAKSKLAEARFLFETALDHEGAMMVRQVLDEIVKSQVDYDEDAEQADLARQAEQMARMPVEGMGATSGMGVTITSSIVPPEDAQKRAKVTVLRRGVEEAS